MNYFLRRVLVGVCIAFVMMLVHKAARADAPKNFYGGASSLYETKALACSSYNATYHVDANGACRTPSNDFVSSLSLFVLCSINPSVAPDTSKPLDQQCPTPPLPGHTGGCPPVGETSGENMEAQTNTATLTICDPNGCGFTGAGSIGRGGKFVTIGPFTSTGSCSQTNGGATDPGDRCSYRNPITNACEAACPTGQRYGQVPTGAMACIKIDGSPPTPPRDSSCPYGYHNISATNIPNCAPDAPGNPPTDSKCPPSTVLVGSAPGYCKWVPPADPPPTTAPPTTNTKTTGTTTTTNNPDGSTTTTQTTTTTNTDGSTTTTTKSTTTKTDGSTSESTTSSTGKIPGTQTDGSSTGTDADKTDFCKQHPNLNICQNSQVSQADCEATQCTGDAIQCAVLRQNMKAYCDSTKATDDSKIGVDIIGGNDPQKGGFPTPANGITVAMPTGLSSSTFLGSACFPDTPFAVRGFSFVIPWGRACAYLVAFRYALMFVVLMMSFHMVTTSVLRET